MNYFQHPFVSNSALSALSKEIYGSDLPDPYDAYRIGSLVDGVITEPALIDRIQMIIKGTDYTFSKSELAMADKMKGAFFNNPLCAQIAKVCKTQVELYVERVPFKVNGLAFTLDMKCKYDFFSSTLFVDLKSTSATTQAQFEAACEQFQYWRQIAHYGNLGKIKRAMIIGVSKVNFKVFTVRLEYGDRRWMDGVKQYHELVYKYHLIKI